MRRSASFICALLISLLVSCSSDGDERSKDPDVSVSGASGGGTGGTTGAGTGGTTAGWPDPSAGTGGTAASTGGAGGTIAGMTGVAGTDFPPIDMRVFDAGDPAANNVMAGTICTRLAQIQCAGEAFCCENPGRDRAACEAAQKAGCDEGLVDDVAKNATAGFDPTHAANAFTQLQQMASVCDTTVASWGATVAGFLGIFKGSVSPGDDCSPGLLLTDALDGAVAIASCNTIDTTACLPDSNNPFTANWFCEAKGAVGDPCLTDLNCQAGLYCPNPVLENGGFDLGTCAARLADGSPCTTGTQCSSFYCVGGSCVPADQQSAYCLASQL